MLEGRNGAVSHLSICSWEEETLPVAPSGEPAYGMKIRLNFTACVSVYSSGVCVGKPEGVGPISGSVPFCVLL